MTGNIGEWSELYTMFKLLADGKLYIADEYTNKIPNVYYDVLKIIRSIGAEKLEYLRENEIKVVNASNKEVICSLPIQKLIDESNRLLEEIHKNKIKKTKGAFEIYESSKFAESIKCNTLKAKSTDKSDIILMVHDIMSGRDDTFGFSIKSQLGNPSTLLNASKSTNFTYKLTGHNLSENEISVFNGYKKFSDKFSYIASLGTNINFVEVDNKTLEFNLQMVTSEMPEILAEMIKYYYQGKSYLISNLVEYVTKSGIINTRNNRVFLEHNIKELLTNIALGMVPNTEWTGNYEATGGYIIVKDNGDIVCYHIYNRNAFRNYIFKNTRFDTPSKSRHNFGNIYEINSEQYIKLNIQIRFLK